LAFAVGVFTIIYLNKKFAKLILLVVGLAIVAFLLPTTRNHSIELFRSFSIIAKADNYRSTLQIFSKSPVFGIGYDNVCIAYQKFIGAQDFSSHACSGSDSSLLFILTTTGIVGLIVFVSSLWKVFKSISGNENTMVLGTTFVALIVHSFFSNSMFYPWIMGWMFILLAEV